MSRRIAIIGANGQVGTEVCLFLRQHEDVEVIPICRTEVGGEFLRRSGLEPRYGTVGDPGQAGALLADCDLVADFSLPQGSSDEIRSAMREIIENATAYAPDGAPFVYLSSITAFGIPDFRGPLKHYRLARNRYGAFKRYAEKLTLSACQKTKRDAYVLRVGVVHGELQAVTRQTLRNMRETASLTAYVPDAPSFTVFAFSIAEALVAISQGHEQPGRYTLVSNPAWSWKDLVEYYGTRIGVPASTRLLQAGTTEGSGAKRMVASTAWRLVSGQKHLSGALATRLPRLERRLKARYQITSAAVATADNDQEGQYRPYGSNHTVFPGRRLRSLSDSRQTMEPAAHRIRLLLAKMRTGEVEQA